MKGREGTAENRYMRVLYGAMTVEWSVSCRETGDALVHESGRRGQ